MPNSRSLLNQSPFPSPGPSKIPLATKLESRTNTVPNNQQHIPANQNDESLTATVWLYPSSISQDSIKRFLDPKELYESDEFMPLKSRIIEAIEKSPKSKQFWIYPLHSTTKSLSGEGATPIWDGLNAKTNIQGPFGYDEYLSLYNFLFDSTVNDKELLFILNDTSEYVYVQSNFSDHKVTRGSHWLFIACNLSKKTITVYDSLGNSNQVSKQIQDNFTKFFEVIADVFIRLQQFDKVQEELTTELINKSIDNTIIIKPYEREFKKELTKEQIKEMFQNMKFGTAKFCLKQPDTILCGPLAICNMILHIERIKIEKIKLRDNLTISGEHNRILRALLYQYAVRGYSDINNFNASENHEQFVSYLMTLLVAVNNNTEPLITIDKKLLNYPQGFIRSYSSLERLAANYAIHQRVANYTWKAYLINSDHNNIIKNIFANLVINNVYIKKDQEESLYQVITKFISILKSSDLAKLSNEQIVDELKAITTIANIPEIQSFAIQMEKIIKQPYNSNVPKDDTTFAGRMSTYRKTQQEATFLRSFAIIFLASSIISIAASTTQYSFVKTRFQNITSLTFWNLYKFAHQNHFSEVSTMCSIIGCLANAFLYFSAREVARTSELEAFDLLHKLTSNNFSGSMPATHSFR